MKKIVLLKNQPYYLFIKLITMKNLLLCVILCLGITVQAQDKPDFQKNDSDNNTKDLILRKGWLDINNISAAVSSTGILFADIEENEETVVGMPFSYDVYSKGFLTDPENELGTIYSSSIWIAGKSQMNELHLAGGFYGFNNDLVGGYSDFYRGPISDTYNYTDREKWDRVWVLTKEEIEFHKIHYNEPGYEPIENILTWPGNGDESIGQQTQIAPFADKNGDGYYNAMDGDFPLIRGDKAVFFVMNDQEFVHSATESESLGVEIHYMVYAFEGDDNEVLANTIFVHYDIYNRSDNEYSNTYIGFFNDFDNGYIYDDYLSSDVKRNSVISYNGLPEDGSGQPYAYGEHPPAQSFTILRGPKADEDDKDNVANPSGDYYNGYGLEDGVIDNERYGLSYASHLSLDGTFGEPSYWAVVTVEDMYNRMLGKWNDGNPMFYGGNAHPDAGGVGNECRFVFPGDSDPDHFGTYGEGPGVEPFISGVEWDESQAENGVGDRRMIASTGAFTFAPGDKQDVDLAYVFARNMDNDISSVELLEERIDDLFEEVEQFDLLALKDIYLHEHEQTVFDEFIVFPNPVQNELKIRSNTEIGSDLYYKVIDITGKEVSTGMLYKNTIPVENLRNGIYILQMYCADKIIGNKQIVVQH
jgi:hypothetical protein